MDATASEIRPLTRSSVAKVLACQLGGAVESCETERRRAVRWPFSGTVEFWSDDGHGREDYAIGTCENMSQNGLGVTCDDPFEPGTTLKVAVHQPSLSLHGRATVRHCTETENGYYCGLLFEFED